MKFKDLKVGDTLYLANPNEWYKPIKKTISEIEPYNNYGWLDFYTENEKYLGTVKAECSQGIKNGIFADFDAFKKNCIEYQKNIIRNINYEIDRLKEQLRLANDDLEIANELQDED